MDAPCPVCRGRCGARWHPRVHASTTRLEGKCNWRRWVDEAALPELLRAEVFLLEGTPTVRDPDGRLHLFDSAEEAFAWLAQEGYIPEAELDDRPD